LVEDANPMVAPIGDIDVTVGIDRDVGGMIEKTPYGQNIDLGLDPQNVPRTRSTIDGNLITTRPNPIEGHVGCVAQRRIDTLI
jgi:hypothetical protein